MLWSLKYFGDFLLAKSSTKSRESWQNWLPSAGLKIFWKTGFLKAPWQCCIRHLGYFTGALFTALPLINQTVYLQLSCPTNKTLARLIWTLSSFARLTLWDTWLLHSFLEDRARISSLSNKPSTTYHHYPRTLYLPWDSRSFLLNKTFTATISQSSQLHFLTNMISTPHGISRTSCTRTRRLTYYWDPMPVRFKNKLFFTFTRSNLDFRVRERIWMSSASKTKLAPKTHLSRLFRTSSIKVSSHQSKTVTFWFKGINSTSKVRSRLPPLSSSKELKNCTRTSLHRVKLDLLKPLQL